MRWWVVSLLVAGCSADVGGPEPATDAEVAVVGAIDDTNSMAEREMPRSNVEVCDERSPDALWLGADCSPIDDPCPAGYACRPRADVVVTLSCEILCENDCDCPEGLSCHWIPDPIRPFQACE